MTKDRFPAGPTTNWTPLDGSAEEEEEEEDEEKEVDEEEVAFSVPLPPPLPAAEDVGVAPPVAPGLITKYGGGIRTPAFAVAFICALMCALI